MDSLNPFMTFADVSPVQGKLNKVPVRNPTLVKAELDDISTFLVEKLGSVLPLENAFFAGGCIRDLSMGLVPKDYDIYFYNTADIQKVKEYFNKHDVGVSKTVLDNFNLTLEYKGKPVVFQFILLMSGTPQNVVAGFDFTMNMNYYIFSTEEIRINPHVGDMRLHPGPNPVRPIHALCRITKFLAKGYTISHWELVELAEKATGHTIPADVKLEQLNHLISGD